jgi:hypothetical protein
MKREFRVTIDAESLVRMLCLYDRTTTKYKGFKPPKSGGYGLVTGVLGLINA